ncbi:hypothetical protein SRHO_G00274610 [Serrasalmus rhombeus]
MASRGRAERCLHRDRSNNSNNFCRFAFVSSLQLQRTLERLAAAFRHLISARFGRAVDAPQVSVPVDDVRRVKEQNKPPLEEQTSEPTFLRGP